MRRELRSASTEQVLGAVVVESGRRRFEGNADRVLSALRRELGDDRTVDVVMSEGWSNGHLYFFPVPPEPALP